MWLVKACDDRDPYGAYLKRIDKFRLNLTIYRSDPDLPQVEIMNFREVDIMNFRVQYVRPRRGRCLGGLSESLAVTVKLG